MDTSLFKTPGLAPGEQCDEPDHYAYLRAAEAMAAALTIHTRRGHLDSRSFGGDALLMYMLEADPRTGYSDVWSEEEAMMRLKKHKP